MAEKRHVSAVGKLRVIRSCYTRSLTPENRRRIAIIDKTLMHMNPAMISAVLRELERVRESGEAFDESRLVQPPATGTPAEATPSSPAQVSSSSQPPAQPPQPSMLPPPQHDVLSGEPEGKAAPTPTSKPVEKPMEKLGVPLTMPDPHAFNPRNLTDAELMACADEMRARIERKVAEANARIEEANTLREKFGAVLQLVTS